MNNSTENPWSRTVEPGVEPVGNASRPGATRETHPAYAVIRANRVSGSTNLFQSDFRHNAFISIQIAKAELVRDLSNDWVHDRAELVEVKLSEAQWASFVSSMNVGVGTPCTLSHLNREPIPGIERPKNRHEQFKRESGTSVEAALKHMQELREAIVQSGLSQKKQGELLNHVMFAERGIGSSQDFIAKQFAEHIEATVEHAKAEVSGYVSGAIRQVGIEALASGQVPGVQPLKLGFPGGDE